jgi:hypothetical protein
MTVQYAPHLTYHGGPVIAKPVVYTLAWDDDAFGWDPYYDETGAGKGAFMDWMATDYGVSSATSAWAGIKLSDNAAALKAFHSMQAATHACSFGCCAEDCAPLDEQCYAKLALSTLIQSGGAAPSGFPLDKQSSYYAVHFGQSTTMALGHTGGWHNSFVRTGTDTCGKQRFSDTELAPAGTLEPGDKFSGWAWLDTSKGTWTPGAPPVSMWVTGDPTHASSGNGYLKLGPDPMTGKSQAIQVMPVNLPGGSAWACRTSALSFDLSAIDHVTPWTGDAFVVTVQGTGAPMTATFSVNDVENTMTSGYDHFWVDLGPYWGQPVSVIFSVTEGANPVTFRLDNVSIR